MAAPRARSTGIFNGLIILLVGLLLLLHNYRGFELGSIFYHWWPLLLILWGAVKIYERTAGARAGDPAAARITGGEVFLVLGLLALLGIVAASEELPRHFPDWSNDIGVTSGTDLNVAPKPIPANSRVAIRNVRGDISVRASDQPEIRVSGKSEGHGWSELDARRNSEHISVNITQNGDGYEIQPNGSAADEGRATVDMEVVLPAKASVNIHNDKGDVSVADMLSAISITDSSGDVEVRNAGSDVAIDMRHGDAKISDVKGDVKISGSGDSVEATNTTGSLTVTGEFVGPIRADKVAKGVRFVSRRTDLTLTQLAGHMEAGSGNLEIVDAPGNLILRTRDEDITVENAGGKLRIENRNGDIEVHFSSPPKDDIEIDNSSAGITLSLPESSSFQILADCHSGDINSEFSADSLKKTEADSGNSHLEGTYGQGRGPKIILKTSYGSISIHKTS